MEKLFKNLKYLMITSLITVILMFFFFVYRPMRNELKESFKRDFIHIVSISEANLENYFKNQIEGTESLSSRTMIRKKFYDYMQNKIDLDTLKKYTQPKYVDGVNALKGIKGALRISINNEVIALCGDVNKKNIKKYSEFKNKTTAMNLFPSENILVVSSPVYEQKELLGYDIACFNLENILSEISRNQIDYSIVKNPKYKKEVKVFDNKMVTVRQILDTEYWLKAEISSNRYAATLRRISILVGAVTIISLIMIILIFRVVIDKTARRVITHLEEINRKVTYLSFHDKLTGVYNRRYFENEMKRLNDSRKLPISIIVGDLDGLKYINDNYGHDKGDKYIKKVAEIFERITRSEDIVARVGGDEFAILLPETSQRDLKQFEKRFFSKIKEINKNEKLVEPLSISIGCATMDRKDQNIRKIYKKADKKMYENKKN
ncbi:MAG: GGDEF domain-containing protein [Candidatus Mcinerneyibacterium aminivorans]|uniref:GGDEF domain-containing protein n=1 Tax=Candidatus Mcinerneyibacterium aminivorans TaxID=2703815 RepID=A0A5D0MFD8_9BACT|nr:MAG: GGDEF domain-containing protein [Candidatus Mcinerneyibacterium aminivorans]